MAAAGNENAVGKEMCLRSCEIPKLPPYNPEAVTSWFAVAETHFDALNCTDDLLRFSAVLQALDETSLMYAR